MIQKTTYQRTQLTSEFLSEPVVLCAADDNYAKPLTVTLQSAAESLRPGNSLQVIVLDGGIQPNSWQMMKESLASLPIELNSLRPDPRVVDGLMTSHHVTSTAYFRLLAGKLLPESIDRVIYLDSDLLVRDDLSILWEMELGDHYCLAVPDIACPHIDVREADCNFRKSSPYLAAISPIGNWRELKLNGSDRYFNSGVMVLNIERWRRESIERQLIRCLKDNRKHVWCWDQYALNVVFAGQWQPIPARWNQGAHLFEYPDETHSRSIAGNSSKPVTILASFTTPPNGSRGIITIITLGEACFLSSWTKRPGLDGGPTVLGSGYRTAGIGWQSM